MAATFVFSVVSGEGEKHRRGFIAADASCVRNCHLVSWWPAASSAPIRPRLRETHVPRRSADREDRAAIRNTLLRNYSAHFRPASSKRVRGIVKQTKTTCSSGSKHSSTSSESIFSSGELDGRFRGEKDVGRGRCKRLKNSSARLHFIIPGHCAWLRLGGCKVSKSIKLVI